MTTIVSTLYHTGSGHTGSLAKAVAEGSGRVEGVETHLLTLAPGQLGADGRWSDDAIMATLDDSDAILFGCPTYMGSVSAIMKAFMEAQLGRWAGQVFKDKFAGGFTNSATMAGDKLNTLVDIVIFAAQLGMLWVPLGADS